MPIFQRRFKGDLATLTVVNYGLIIVFMTLFLWYGGAMIYVMCVGHRLNDATSGLLATYGFSTAIMLQLSFYSKVDERNLARFAIFYWLSCWIAVLSAAIGGIVYLKSVVDWTGDDVVFFVAITVWLSIVIAISTLNTVFRIIESLGE